MKGIGLICWVLFFFIVAVIFFYKGLLKFKYIKEVKEKCTVKVEALLMGFAEKRTSLRKIMYYPLFNFNYDSNVYHIKSEKALKRKPLSKLIGDSLVLYIDKDELTDRGNITNLYTRDNLKFKGIMGILCLLVAVVCTLGGGCLFSLMIK